MKIKKSSCSDWIHTQDGMPMAEIGLLVRHVLVAALQQKNENYEKQLQ
jgi:hypothetical protein